jgi:hypothetical protein
MPSQLAARPDPAAAACLQGDDNTYPVLLIRTCTSIGVPNASVPDRTYQKLAARTLTGAGSSAPNDLISRKPALPQGLCWFVCCSVNRTLAMLHFVCRKAPARVECSGKDNASALTALASQPE